MPGLIEKATISGSDNPERYLKRLDRNKWVKGGYCIQASPFELAQTISAIRSHAAPRSMLCIGVDSAGTERFMAEELGIMSIRFTGESEHPAFEGNCEALQVCGVKKAEVKTFDLVTVFGGSAMTAFEAVKPFLREGTVVAVFETGLDAMQPECRLLWHAHRKSQNVILHTHEQGVGVFMVKNLTAMGVTIVRAEAPKPRVQGGDESVGKPAGVLLHPNSPDVEGGESPSVAGLEESKPPLEPDNSGHEVPDETPQKTPQAPPKRRGRPPRVKA